MVHRNITYYKVLTPERRAEIAAAVGAFPVAASVTRSVTVSARISVSFSLLSMAFIPLVLVVFIIFINYIPGARGLQPGFGAQCALNHREEHIIYFKEDTV